MISRLPTGGGGSSSGGGDDTPWASARMRRPIFPATRMPPYSTGCADPSFSGTSCAFPPAQEHQKSVRGSRALHSTLRRETS
ncbi:unnamed protein product [Notodromas monacha]|uniref:Uncharacterized protein n=1 Tax=Notodromas monacha TaxID=399045 RepID=A0A7R9BRK3_9CRUS|nr:unnamed protein product [Notodromas monacha]CAG0919025.1 unnamed protein product [Notodromas monacha]